MDTGQHVGGDPAPKAKVTQDEAVKRRVLKLCDQIERMNDGVGDTRIRHFISDKIVRIRLLVRDGNLDNFCGGRVKP